MSEHPIEELINAKTRRITQLERQSVIMRMALETVREWDNKPGSMSVKEMMEEVNYALAVTPENKTI